MIEWRNLTVFVAGGTGSFGKKFAEIILKHHPPKKLIIFSRDELKQYEMRQRFAEYDSILRFFIGDVRDGDRLRRAMHGVDVVIHAAAMKQIPSCEYNPFEAVLTNIIGTRNIIDAAIDCGVKRALLISTDKAVNPVNLYGATKLCAEKLFVNGNAYSGVGGTRFSAVRYGNVVGSRGSVIPLFVQQRRNGHLTLTDERMTRFWITLQRAVEFVASSIADMQGGEIFVPKLPSMRVIDLARAISKNSEIRIIGVRPGEKIHELLVSDDEARHALEFEDRFVILPFHASANPECWRHGRPLPDGFRYASDTNAEWLDVEDFDGLVLSYPELAELVQDSEKEESALSAGTSQA
jgi:UDP-N-acetylglucosamine 4,6-dehydratase